MDSFVVMLQSIAPIVIGQMVPWMTKALHSQVVSLPSGWQWAFTVMVAPLLSGIASAFTGVDGFGLESAVAATAIAATAHAQVQGTPMVHAPEQKVG